MSRTRTVTLSGGPHDGEQHKHDPRKTVLIVGPHYYRRDTETPHTYRYDRATRQRTLVPVSSDPEMINRAAAIYRAAGLTGLAPSKAVAGALGVSPATAGRLIRQARDSGKLPDSKKGVANFAASEHTPRKVRWSDGSESWLACIKCKQPWPCEPAIEDNAEGIQ